MRTNFRSRLIAAVAAVAVVFSGLAATPASAAPLSNLPTALTATSGLRSVSLSWSAPAASINGYYAQISTATSFPAGATTSAKSVSGTTTSFAGLADGGTYYVRVASVTGTTVNTYTAAVKVLTLAAPGAPSGVKTVPGVGAVALTWTAPALAVNTSPITGYKVEYSTDTTFTDSTKTQSVNTQSTDKAFTVTGLAANTTYGFRVYALNSVTAAGVTPVGSAIAKALTSTVPAAPAIASIVNGKNQYTITWKAPTNGGSAITGYRVQYSTDSTFTTGTTDVDVSATTLSRVVTGLPNGAVLYARVAATNAVGMGAYSGASSANVFNVPGAPLAPALKNTGKGAMTITWKAPGSTGGTPITGYTVQYSTSSTFASGVTTTTLAANVTSLAVTGLPDGTPCYVKVIASNMAGNSAASPAGTLATFATANAPTLAPLVVGKGTLAVTWTPAVTNGGTPVTGYSVQYSTSSTFATLSGAQTLGNVKTTTLTGLADGTTYYVRVASINVVGTGAYSDAVTGSTFALAGAPTGVTAAGSPAKISVTWTAPAVNGGTPVTGYKVEYSTDPLFLVSVASVTTTAALTTATLSNLPAGTTYYVRVTTTNIVGSSIPASPVNATTSTGPGAPAGLAFSSISTSGFTVAWDAPSSNGGQPVTAYNIQYSTNSAFISDVQSVMGVKAATSGRSNLPLKALGEGVTYYVRVQAITVAGTGAYSTGASVRTISRPGTPTGIAVVPGAGKVTVSWTPGSLGTSPTQGFNVQIATNPDFINATVVAGVQGTSTEVTGLAAGADYYVRMSATNLVGTSAFGATVHVATDSAPSAARTPVISWTAGDTAALTWVAPVSTGTNGPATITYLVQYSTDSTFATDVTTVRVVDALSADVVVPTFSGTYYFRVAASTAAGASAYTNAVGDASSGYASPDQVTALTAGTITGSTVAFSWNAPASLHKSALVGYTFQYSTDSTFTTGVNTVSNLQDTSYTLTGLTAGTVYYARVAAVNGVGTGTYSVAASRAPGAAPSIVTAPTVTVASATSLGVSFSAPNANGYPVTGYKVQYSTSATFTSGVTTVDASGLSKTLTGLTTGSTYYVRVAAVNGVGTGPSSITTSQVPGSTPSAPSAPTAALTGVNTADVSFAVPNSNGYAITGYTVTAIPNAGLSIVVDGTVAHVSGMSAGTSYVFTVKATNALGEGVNSAASNTVSTPDVASAPAAVTVLVTSPTSVLLTWNAPAAHGSAVTSYVVVSAEGTVVYPVDRTVPRANITGLTAGRSYVFTVVAVNGVGSSAAGSSVSTLIATAPAAPAAPSVTIAGLNALDVAWDAPTANGSMITGYRIQFSNDATFATGVNAVDVTANITSLSGLTAGSATYIRVAAVNAYGMSDYSEATHETPGAAPVAPSAPAVTVAGLHQISATWTAPAANGYAITGYQVQVSTDASFTDATVIATSQTTALISDLTPGTPYFVRVAAVNARGTGEYSEATSGIAGTAPDAPSAPVATLTGLTTADVAFTAPAANGYLITGYTVTGTGVTADQITVDGTTAHIARLNAGTTYSFTVTATNARGTSSKSSASNTITTATNADAVTNVAVEVTGLTTVTVTWNAPVNNNGAAVTHYEVTSDPAGATIVVDGTQASVTGLTNGQAYVFAIKAMNAVGASAATYSASTLIATAPAAPAAPSVVIAAVDALNISYSAQASNGSPVTGYRVQYSTSNDFTNASTVDTASTDFSATGLTAGYTYYVRVAAVNAYGVSVYSDSASMVPGAAPAAPAAPVATLTGLTTADVSFAVPNSNGYAITGYTMTATPAEGVVVVMDGTVAHVSNLTSGTVYTFTVEANNAMGASATSSVSAPIRTASESTPVFGVEVTISSTTTADVAWVAPVFDGGTPVTGYTVTSVPSDATIVVNGTTATVTGLTTGQSYVFTVQAINAVGLSTPVNSLTTLVATSPEAPAAPAVTVDGMTSVAATWSAPAANGSPVTGYRVQYSTSSDFTSASTVDTSGTSYTASGLSTGSVYYVRVAAVNAYGVGTYSVAAQQTPGAAPAAPSSVIATMDGLYAINVNWTAPNANGYALTGYTVTASPSTGLSILVNGNSAYVTGITLGQTYTFSVVATNALGSSTSTESAPLATATTPDAATNVTATVTGTTSADVTWTAPAFNGGAPITSYTVTSTPGGANIVVDGTTAHVTGLTTGTSYVFTVNGVNVVGSSPSASSATTLIATAPAAPAAPTVTVTGTTTANVTFSAPVTNGSAITGYTVTSTPAGAVVNGGTAVTAAGTYSVTGLTNGASYTFTVTATNGIGSTVGSSSAATLIATVPGVPSGLTGSATSKTSLRSTWNGPAANGSAITGYSVQYSTDSINWTTASSSLTMPVDISGLNTGSSYFVRVAAVNALGMSAYATLSSPVLVGSAPDAPAGINALLLSATSATISWNPAAANGSAITGYTVYYSTDPAMVTGVASTSVAADVNSSTLTGLAQGATYYFAVTATNGFGQGARSAAASRQMTSLPTASPASMSINGQSYDSTSVNIWWSPVDGINAGGLGINYYVMQYTTDSSFNSIYSQVTIGGTGTNGFNMPSTQTWYFRVAAVNNIGQGPWSAAHAIRWYDAGTGYQYWTDYYSYDLVTASYPTCNSGDSLSGDQCTHTSLSWSSYATPVYACVSHTSTNGGTAAKNCNSTLGSYNVGTIAKGGTYWTSSFGRWNCSTGTLVGSDCYSTSYSYYTATWVPAVYAWSGGWAWHEYFYFGQWY
jgi:titin